MVSFSASDFATLMANISEQEGKRIIYATLVLGMPSSEQCGRQWAGKRRPLAESE
jgi:hypothetical protein